MTLFAGLALLGVATAIAVGEETSKDQWKPVNTQFKAASTNTVFKVGTFLEEKCQLFQIKGKTPAGNGTEFADQVKINVGKPLFEGCKPGAVAASGQWTLELHSGALQKPQETECSGASGGQYNPATEDDDCITVHIPVGGAVVGPVAGCTITVAPTQAVDVTGYYDDETGIATFNVTSLAIEKKGGLCPGGEGAGTSEFKGTFPVNPIITD